MENKIKFVLNGVVMEEKDRYEWNSPYDSAVRDNKNDDIINAIERLNEQDKRIKELELEVKVGEFWHSGYQGKQLEYDMVYDELRQSYDEIEKLKQQLHDLPKKIVGEVENNFTEYLPLKYKTGAGFYSRLNAILKKYGVKQ